MFASLFRYKGLVWRILNTLTDILALSLLWAVCSLPLVTLEVVAEYRKKCALHGWAFLDAEGIAEFNTVDFMHLSAKGHRQLAEALAQLVPTLA